MPVTGAVLGVREENLKEIERLAASEVLHGSDSLCRLLRYLAEQAATHPGVPIKEYQIATEVFGRPHDFDPRLDSTVRVQTGRLRAKLSEYYSGAGSEDPIVAEVPKGTYSLVFHTRTLPAPVIAPALPSPLGAGELLKPPNSANVHSDSQSVRQHPRGLVLVAALLALGLIAALLTLAYVLSRPAGAVPVARDRGDAAYRLFWKGFIDHGDSPWVVFSNAPFVGRPETGLRYFNPVTDHGQPTLDHYTGVGEVLAMHELDRVFATLNHTLRAKRGRLLSLDDVKNDDIIFLGSPSENLPLLDVPPPQHFVFGRGAVAARGADLCIVNLHRRPSEPAAFYASSAVPLSEDYALIVLRPGINPAHWAMILAGTTTIGTQAAAEYVCRPETIRDLLTRVTGSPNGEVRPFEAVLHVSIKGGVPVQSDVVAVRTGA